MKPPVISMLAHQPRDVHALFEISHKNIQIIIEALNRCEIKIDRTVEAEVRIEEVFMDFYNQLKQLDKELVTTYGSPPDSQ